MSAKMVIATSLLLSLGLAHAEMSSADKTKQQAQTCAACHGADGNASTPAQSQYPRLGGQYHDYLERALHEYKSGERKNPIMQGFAATLSDAEMDALARYFAAMPSKIDDLSKYEQGN